MEHLCLSLCESEDIIHIITPLVVDFGHCSFADLDMYREAEGNIDRKEEEKKTQVRTTSESICCLVERALKILAM